MADLNDPDLINEEDLSSDDTHADEGGAQSLNEEPIDLQQTIGNPIDDPPVQNKIETSPDLETPETIQQDNEHTYEHIDPAFSFNPAEAFKTLQGILSGSNKGMVAGVMGAYKSNIEETKQNKEKDSDLNRLILSIEQRYPEIGKLLSKARELLNDAEKVVNKTGNICLDLASTYNGIAEAQAAVEDAEDDLHQQNIIMFEHELDDGTVINTPVFKDRNEGFYIQLPNGEKTEITDQEKIEKIKAQKANGSVFGNDHHGLCDHLSEEQKRFIDLQTRKEGLEKELGKCEQEFKQLKDKINSTIQDLKESLENSSLSNNERETLKAEIEKLENKLESQEQKYSEYVSGLERDRKEYQKLLDSDAGKRANEYLQSELSHGEEGHTHGEFKDLNWDELDEMINKTYTAVDEDQEQMAQLQKSVFSSFEKIYNNLPNIHWVGDTLIACVKKLSENTEAVAEMCMTLEQYAAMQEDYDDTKAIYVNHQEESGHQHEDDGSHDTDSGTLPEMQPDLIAAKIAEYTSALASAIAGSGGSIPESTLKEMAAEKGIPESHFEQLQLAIAEIAPELRIIDQKPEIFGGQGTYSPVADVSKNVPRAEHVSINSGYGHSNDIEDTPTPYQDAFTSAADPDAVNNQPTRVPEPTNVPGLTTGHMA